MSREVHAKTLFHLVPRTQSARDALLHPENARFVSRSANKTGFEIGFHVSPNRPGRVIARLGRGKDADLILREPSISGVHAAFEIHPETGVLLLSVRTTHQMTVRVSPAQEGESEELSQLDAGENAEGIPGGCVLLYGQMYSVGILSYSFTLVWRENYTIESLRELAMTDYHDSLLRLADLRSRDRPTDLGQSEFHTWYCTRLVTANQSAFREAPHPRTLISEGNYGTVYQTLDLATGNKVAVKVVKLANYNDIEHARVALHREIKMHKKLHHDNIIPCLAIAKWETGLPEIFMPRRPGTLRSLANDEHRPCDENRLCRQVLRQMLAALDYLANQKLCHRDVKPDNILYYGLGEGTYCFQLADFGLANHQNLATTSCGTAYYQAPESRLKTFAQTPKMDVWSLFATLIDIHSSFVFPPKFAPPRHANYEDVLLAIRGAADKDPELGLMAREDPAHRASAAQMLVKFFKGKGLTTDSRKVEPLSDAAPLNAPEVQQPCVPKRQAALPTRLRRSPRLQPQHPMVRRNRVAKAKASPRPVGGPANRQLHGGRLLEMVLDDDEDADDIYQASEGQQSDVVMRM